MNTETNDWRNAAACKGLDPAIFHPGKGETGTKARKVCAVCPVVDDCLQDALDDPQQLGIAGNTSLVERRIIARQRGDRAALEPVNHGTRGGYSAHYRRGEKPCDACSTVELAAQAIRRAAKRAALQAA